MHPSDQLGRRGAFEDGRARHAREYAGNQTPVCRGDSGPGGLGAAASSLTAHHGGHVLDVPALEDDVREGDEQRLLVDGGHGGEPLA